VTHLLVWSLSPVGTLLNAAMLFVVLVIAGADWTRPLLWLIVAIFMRLRLLRHPCLRGAEAHGADGLRGR